MATEDVGKEGKLEMKLVRGEEGRQRGKRQKRNLGKRRNEGKNNRRWRMKHERLRK